MTTAELLARCSLFRDFTETGLHIVASIATERSFPAGSSLFVEGSESDSFFLLRKGTVEISVAARDGQPNRLGVLGEGEFFGEMALVLPNSHRLVSATATTAVEAIEIRQRDFARLQTQKPQACVKLIFAIANSFRAKLIDSKGPLSEVLSAVVPR